MAIIFYHDDEQKEAALKSKSELQNDRGRDVTTQVEPFSKFYMAEDYHQKYYLQNDAELAYEIKTYYPDFEDFVNSTAAARLNGLVGGYAGPDLTAEELESYGLSALGLELIQRYIKQ